MFWGQKMNSLRRQKAWARPGKAARQSQSKYSWQYAFHMVGSGGCHILRYPETLTADRYRQQMIKLDRAVKDKRPQYDGRHDKVILQHGNARLNIAKTVQETLQVLNWEILPHPSY